MKNLLLLSLFFFSLQVANAQFKLGVRGGLSTMDIQGNDLVITNSNDAKAFGLAVNEANYGAHIGFFAQAQLGNFFIQPEVLFNSNTVEYTLSDFGEGGVINTLKSESFQNLDIPVMMGVKWGPLRLQGGPVAHVFINSKSELFDIAGYEQKFDEMNWGYQAGVGLDIWKFIIDVKYEGSFQKFGDHMVFAGQQYNFDDSPGRFIASLGIAF